MEGGRGRGSDEVRKEGRKAAKEGEVCPASHARVTSLRLLPQLHRLTEKMRKRASRAARIGLAASRAVGCWLQAAPNNSKASIHWGDALALKMSAAAPTVLNISTRVALTLPLSNHYINLKNRCKLRFFFFRDYNS
ncbi:hypothetical protein E2C01_097208 [Portunus trituberculatus]|uniref:Uncharacterized protein n=1 Tax=Portunus trituberculatus TaxID=210409 RepID=A0A5B7K3W8_PORTR|nr:hypothetical protein [Portunus trituberculatus]